MAAATVPYRLQDAPDVEVRKWTLTTADGVGDPILLPAHSDVSWQVFGAFGGGTFKPEASMDGTNFAQFNNVAGGVAAALTAAGILTTIEGATYKRPTLTGSAGASITVYAFLRKPPRNPGR